MMPCAALDHTGTLACERSYGHEGRHEANHEDGTLRFWPQDDAGCVTNRTELDLDTPDRRV